MNREIFRNLEEGAREALRAYVVLIMTPFMAARCLAATVGKAFHWF